MKWLRVAKSTVKLTTYASYEMMATKIIIPDFQILNIKLKELTTEDIQDFYSAQLERVSANTVSLSTALRTVSLQACMIHTVTY